MFWSMCPVSLHSSIHTSLLHRSAQFLLLVRPMDATDKNIQTNDLIAGEWTNQCIDECWPKKRCTIIIIFHVRKCVRLMLCNIWPVWHLFLILIFFLTIRWYSHIIYDSCVKYISGHSFSFRNRQQIATPWTETNARTFLLLIQRFRFQKHINWNFLRKLINSLLIPFYPRILCLISLCPQIKIV